MIIQFPDTPERRQRRCEKAFQNFTAQEFIVVSQNAPPDYISQETIERMAIKILGVKDEG